LHKRQLILVVYASGTEVPAIVASVVAVFSEILAFGFDARCNFDHVWIVGPLILAIAHAVEKGIKAHLSQPCVEIRVTYGIDVQHGKVAGEFAGVIVVGRVVLLAVATRE
jgi:hypothetical protein